MWLFWTYIAIGMVTTVISINGKPATNIVDRIFWCLFLWPVTWALAINEIRKGKW